MDQLMQTATSSFNTTTGFELTSVADWMWVNLAEPILGGGLAAIYTLRWYIISLVLITVIVFFAFKFWRMWRGAN